MKEGSFFGRLIKIKGFGYIVLALIAGLALLLLRDGGEAAVQTDDSAADYVAHAEARLAELGKAVCGTDCTAVVYVESGFRYSYACDQSVTVSYNPDGSVAGKETNLTNRTVNTEHGTAPVLLKASTPKIGGVAMVCRGASAANISRLRTMVSSLYGIPEETVYVTN